MARRRVRFKHQKQRPVLSDTLPYEVPASFSNRHFFDFLVKNEVEYRADRLQWVCANDELDSVVRLIFGIAQDSPVSTENLFQWGKLKKVRFVPRQESKTVTIPYSFRISHKENEARTLTICHPRNQLAVAEFYYRFNSLIVYYASLSPFSIRKPVGVARFTYFKDRTHYRKLATERRLIEETGREYEQVGSYFAYYLFSNVHKFFESYPYHKAEKKYNKLLRIDISKCFDSIYTHSLAWAILGKQASKDSLGPSINHSFPGRFDELMRHLNHNETNGIVIGPEFSRVFAEIILQSVDGKLRDNLEQVHKLRHKKHYEIFRYVDDYFVFYNSEADRETIVESLSFFLGDMKLHINAAKTVVYEKPIITEMTIAKDRVSSLLNKDVSGDLTEIEPESGGDEIKRQFKIDIDSTSLIVKYKTIVKESKVNYKDILNYTFSVLERRIERVIGDFFSADEAFRSNKKLVRALLAIVEFAFFAYAASPRVNHTIRICRILSAVVELFSHYPMGFELKHFAFKFIFDNVVQQLEKNTVTPYREVETLYLLIILKQLGREYWLEERELARYFNLLDEGGNEVEGDDIKFKDSPKLSYFSITVGLLYMKHKGRYAGLRALFEQVVIDRITARKAYCRSDAELLMLAMDIWACPYVSEETKAKVAEIYGLSEDEVAGVRSASENWFTTWDRFNFQEELDAKRSREVY